MKRVNEEAMLDRFSKNLIEIRVRSGLTQGELAARAEIHRTQISLIESGRRAPRLPTLISIAGALEVPITDLLAGISYTRAITTPGGFEVDESVGNDE